MFYSDCIVINLEKIEPLVKRIIDSAVDYQLLTNRKLGITGEIGELLIVLKVPGLRLCVSSIEEGYDAIDEFGKRVQIKTRRGAVTDVPKISGRIGTFSKHEFDYALFALLSKKYEVIEIWKANFTDVNRIVEKHKRRNPTIREFINISELVYGKSILESQAKRLARELADEDINLKPGDIQLMAKI